MKLALYIDGKQLVEEHLINLIGLTPETLEEVYGDVPQPQESFRLELFDLEKRNVVRAHMDQDSIELKMHLTLECMHELIDLIKNKILVMIANENEITSQVSAMLTMLEYTMPLTMTGELQLTYKDGMVLYKDGDVKGRVRIPFGIKQLDEIFASANAAMIEA